jgi:Cu-Zn family superoxide dismutase
LPNIYVPASGELTFEAFNRRLPVDGTLLDDDGAAIVIHEGADDYETDPAGAAGDRIACGVLKSGPGE